MVQRVVATESALALIARLQAKHGELIFFQSGGCCDGSAPNCYTQREFQPAAWDIHVGDIGGCPYYISPGHHQYSKNTRILIDTTPGKGGDFSLEAGEGICFIAHSEMYTEAEWPEVEAILKTLP